MNCRMKNNRFSTFPSKIPKKMTISGIRTAMRVTWACKVKSNGKGGLMDNFANLASTLQVFGLQLKHT